MTAAERLVWRAVGVTKRGASHERKGLENQDSVGVRTSDRESPLIDRELAGQSDIAIAADGIAVAVADGHGSATAFRSAQGAVFAVEACLELVKRMLEPGLAARMLGESTSEWVSASSWRRSRRRWSTPLARPSSGTGPNRLPATSSRVPSSADELDRLVATSGPQALARIERNPLLPYGSTLLGAVGTADFVAFLQLGDGDIIVVDGEGLVSRPIEPDPALFANETTSLCLPEAWRAFRFAVVEPSAAPVVLLSTDGLANSYTDEEAFLLFGRDVAEQVRADGLVPSARAWSGGCSRSARRAVGTTSRSVSSQRIPNRINGHPRSRRAERRRDEWHAERHRRRGPLLAAVRPFLRDSHRGGEPEELGSHLGLPVRRCGRTGGLRSHRDPRRFPSSCKQRSFAQS